MTQKFTLHTHTMGFDGLHSAAGMVAAAKNSGMHTIGISNHFIVHPDVSRARFYKYAQKGGYEQIYSHSFPQIMSRFAPHYNELAHVSAASRDICVLRGMEVDFFQDVNWQRGFERAVRELRPDYIIGACHLIEYNGRLCNVHDIYTASQESPEDARKMLKIYWDNVTSAAKSGMFSWIAHLDLPKKVGMGCGPEWHDAEYGAVCALAANGVATEINTGGFSRRNCYEPYPSSRVMRMLAEQNVPVIFSDDAHAMHQIGRHFDLAQKMASGHGVKNFANLHKILAFSGKIL